mmetsp:Transcript_767/g.1367  ORF Transcript_767/g.1367 Transcript_767/m.1367 type:complete len:562 (+) Transcript_767:229-1914(+)
MVLPHLQNNHRTGNGRCGPNQITSAIIFILALILIVINYDDETGMISSHSAGTHSSNEFYSINEREEFTVDIPSVINGVEDQAHPGEDASDIQVQRESSDSDPEPDYDYGSETEHDPGTQPETESESEPETELEAVPETATIASKNVVENPSKEYLPSNSAALSHPLNLPSIDLNCEVVAAKTSPVPITPIYTASYPGGGAKLTSKIIEALTGIITGDDYNSNEETNNVVSIRTYYPHFIASKVDLTSEFIRSILVVRNPLNAVPSLHNFVYESENKLPEHFIRAPSDAWLEWRDKNFATEISSWAIHIRSWMYRSENKSDRLVISFERLADENLGPLEVTRLAEFLCREDGVSTRQPEDMPCIWWKVVNFKNLAMLLQNQQWNWGTRRLRQRKLQEAGFLPPPASGEKIIAQIQEDADAKREAAKDADSPHQTDPNAPQITEDQMMAIKKMQQEQQQQQQPFLREQEELLSENSFSIRGGAKYLPSYTEDQLKMAIDTISNLLFEFENEQTLSAALSNYILDAKKRLDLIQKENEHVKSNIAAAVEGGAPPPNENSSPST